MSKNFTNDLKELYDLVGSKQKELGQYFKIVEDESCGFKQMRVFIDRFLQKIGLSLNNENRLSALTRLIALRDEQLVQSLVKEDFNQAQIDEVKEESYQWVKEFYLKRHQELLDIIDEKKASK